MQIRWHSKYETGQPLIDLEHRLLIMLFKKLDVAIKSNQSDKILTRIVSEVRRFVDFHFVSEENLMLETDYPGFEVHQKIHTGLMTELNVMIARVVAHREYPEELLSFLNQWLINHIGTHDQRVAEHVKNSKERPVAEQVYSKYLPSSADVTSD